MEKQTEEVPKNTQEKEEVPKNTQEKEEVPQKTQENEDKQPQEKKQHRRPQRRVRFIYPDNWRKEIEDSITLTSTIPVSIREDKRLKKPDLKNLKIRIKKIDEDVQRHYDKLNEYKDRIRKIIKESRNKNSGIYDELNKLRKEKRGYVDNMKNNKMNKQNLLDKVTVLEAKIKTMEKKTVGDRLPNKAKVLALIKHKEEEFRNKMKTATEEKKFIDEISRLKKSLQLVPQVEQVFQQRKKLKEKLKFIAQDNKKNYDKLKKVEEFITDLQTKLDEQNLGLNKDKKKEEPKVDEDGKPVKKKRPQTQAEIDLQNMKDEVFKELKQLKALKQKCKTKFDEDSLNFEKENFEMKKIFYMQKCQKKLKWEERKKQRAEEDAQMKVYEEEQEKERLKSKYQSEVDLCEMLIGELEEIKNPTKVETNEEENKNIKTVYKVDEKVLNDENLEVVISKKDKEDVSQNYFKKKKRKRKNKQKKKKVLETENKLKINIYAMQNFETLSIQPPQTLDAVDEIIGQLNDKRKYFLDKRAEEIEKANQIQKEEKDDENVEGEEKVEKDQKKEERKKSDAKKKAPKKQLKMNEEDFPEL